MAWPVIRLLVAAVFAWSASLLTPLDGASQLALWVTFAVLDTAGRSLSAPLLGRLDEVERWVLVGDEATAERLKAYAAAARSTPPSSAPWRPSRTAPTRPTASPRWRSSTATAPTAS